jgi:hypothetical protein
VIKSLARALDDAGKAASEKGPDDAARPWFSQPRLEA